LARTFFSIYYGGIPDVIKADHYISYANDSNVISTDNELEEAMRKAEETSAKHVAELTRLGLKVNESKSEVVILAKRLVEQSIMIGNTLVRSKSSMKNLVFNHERQSILVNFLWLRLGWVGSAIYGLGLILENFP